MLRAIIRICIDRRVATLVTTLVLAAFGVFAYLHTPVEAYPDVTNLQVNVISQVPGLAPPEIERQVTIPLERVLNGIPKLIGMRSESLFGLSLIYLTFDDDADSFHARALVSERLRQADLPTGVVPELGPDATPLGEVYHYRLESSRHTLEELRSEQEWHVRPTMMQVAGVADVVSRGGFLKEFAVEVDRGRLLAHGLTLADVTEALRQANENVGGGFLRQGEQQLVIRSVGYFASADDVKRVVLESEHGVPVTVGDVARVLISHTPRQGAVGRNDEDEIVQGVVFMRRGENPGRVLEGVHDKIDELNRTGMPAGMRLVPCYDQSRMLGYTLETVHHNLLEGALMVVGVVWLFLRSFRGSLIVGAVIPLSLLAAFTGLYFIHLPANLISMGAIDFGIIVDGAVILVENVMHEFSARRPESPEEARKSVARAAFDVAKPTLYAMSIIIAALLPVFSLQRVEGRIFRPLAMTYSFALVGALVFSLTVVPALAAMVIKPGKVQAEDPHFIAWLRLRYSGVLTRFLKQRTLAVAVAAALLVSGVVFGARLGTEFLPELDEGDLTVFVELPTSISLERGQEIFGQLRRRLAKFPEVNEVYSRQGRPEDGTDNESVNMAAISLRMKPKDAWRPGYNEKRLVDEMRESVDDIPGITTNFSQPIRDNVEESISGVRGKVALKIFGTDLELMRATMLKAVTALANVPGIVELSLYRDRAVPQLEIDIDRDACARAGLSIDTVQRTVETALAGTVATEVWEGERVVPVRVRLPLTQRASMDRIGDIYVTTPRGVNLPLRTLATIRTTPGRASINRERNSRALSLKFNIEGRDMGSVVNDAMAKVHADVPLPEGYRLEWGGEFENQARAMKRLLVVVPVSLLIVFALLYMALRSGRNAVSVIVLAPFAMTGGVFALALTGIHLSVSAAIGFIALLGQVALLSLLVLGAIDEQEQRGFALARAVVQGASLRLRAVLMASSLGMLGLLPMALSTGMGAETQRPFAVVLIGGLVTTLLVVLLVLPVVYTWLSRQALALEEASP